MEKEISCTHYFLIADVHLETMANQQAFFDMLNAIDQFPADYAVVFLGDIFDVWFSLRHYEEPLQCRFLDWCSKAGTQRKIFFVEGNHEFYVERKYRSSHFQVQSCYIIRDHLKFIHGDLINTSDRPYFFLRFLLRNPITMCFLNLLGKAGIKCLHHCNLRLRSMNRKHKSYLPEKHIREYLNTEAQNGIRKIFAGHFHVRATYTGQNGTQLEIIPAFYSNQEIGLYHVQEQTLQVAPWQSFDPAEKN